MTAISSYSDTEIYACNDVQPLDSSYRRWLVEYRLPFSEAGPFLTIGKPTGYPWALHISAVTGQADRLFTDIVPLLKEARMSFRIIKDPISARELMAGSYGYVFLGRMLTIYPESAKEATRICGQLIQASKSLKGPAISGGYHLGGTVYTSYGKDEDGALECQQQADGKTLWKYFNRISFQLPKGVQWPFDAIVKYQKPEKNQLPGNNYLVRSIIKSDVKGNVLKALILKWGLLPTWCVVKEGVRGINEDTWGRDAADRVLWQCQIYGKLKGVIRMPELVSHVTTKQKEYMITRYIKSVTLEVGVENIFQGQDLGSLPSSKVQTLASYILSILEVIKNMHQVGVLHRDITPFNFVVGRKGLACLDLELCYEYRDDQPSPAFEGGTSGYMSPQQEAGDIPTPKDDIFSVGALIIFVLTGLYPNHFATCDPLLTGNMAFFTRDDKLGAIIGRCLESTANRRPPMGEISGEITAFKNERIGRGIAVQDLTREELLVVATQGLSGFHFPGMYDRAGYWKSRDNSQVKIFSGQSRKEITQPGYFDGVSGVLYVLFTAMRCGVKWQYDPECLTRNISFALESAKDDRQPVGLESGIGGIELMYRAGRGVGVFSGSELQQINVEERVRQVFESWQSADLTLAGGIAGLALSEISSGLNGGLPSERLNTCIDILCSLQQDDGSWAGVVSPGFFNGSPGIVWMLLSYLRYFPDQRVALTALKALSQLTKEVKRHKDSSPWLSGYSGTALTLLKGYKLFGDARCLDLGESLLNSHPAKILSNCFSLAGGLCGLGEIYLTASQYTNNEKWKDRAAWIAQVLGRTIYRPQPDAGYWMTDRTFQPLPGLMEGTGGPVHFLMRYLYPDKISFPIPGD